MSGEGRSPLSLILVVGIPIFLALSNRTMVAVALPVATISTIASTGGPALAGLLLVSFGWRSLFAAFVPIALLAMAVLARQDLPPAERRPIRFDLRGFLWLVVFVLASTLGLEALRLPDGGAGRGRGALGAGALAAPGLGSGLPRRLPDRGRLRGRGLTAPARRI